MVLSYTLCQAKYWRRRENVPPSQAILMVMQRRWRKSRDITWYKVSRATLEATGRCPAIRQLLAPCRPGGSHDVNQQNKDAKCTLFGCHLDGHCDAAVLYRAHRLVEEVRGIHKSHKTPPTDKHSLQYYQSDTPTLVDSYISSWKRAPVDMLAPNNNRGVTYQTARIHISKTIGYLVGVVKLACYSLNTCLLLRVFTNNHLKYLSNRTSKKLVRCYVYEYFNPPRLAPYHYC